MPGYPKEGDSFCGLYGYNVTYTDTMFLGKSNRFYLLESAFMGQERTYVVDLEKPGDVRWIDFLGHQAQNTARQGHYDFLKGHDDIVVIRYSSCNQPASVYAIKVENLDTAQSLNDLEFKSVKLAENVMKDEEFGKAAKSIQKETIRLENGAEASFIRLAGDAAQDCPARGEDGKFPMIALIHGGPFGASPLDMFLIQRNFLILQGYCLLIINYRGSIGYGKDFMDSLLGHIGSRDVEDCGDLAKLAIEKFSDVVDPKRVCVEGGSHGGFMTGWLIGHKDYKDMWAASSIWNGVLDMTYMVTSTDIPDWIFACCQNKELTDFSQYNVEDSQEFFAKSPISQIGNVKTPTLLVVGASDHRVPPHQSYFYYNCLKSKGVDAKLYNYPESGHSLSKTPEHTHDAFVNIALWMDQYAMKPYRPEDPSEDEEDYKWPPLESNPEVFTDYLQNIGLSKDWGIGEVFGFDEELLAFLP